MKTKHTITISKYELDVIDNTRCIVFYIGNYPARFLEWINSDNSVETYDSHLSLVQADELTEAGINVDDFRSLASGLRIQFKEANVSINLLFEMLQSIVDAEFAT